MPESQRPKKRQAMREIFYLLLIFAASVLLRKAPLNQPLADHGGFVAAQTLISVQVWGERGLWRCHVAPITSFQQPGDVGVRNIGKLLDADGQCYHISYPPLGYLLPYAGIQLFQPADPVQFLKLFGLFAQLLAAAILYLLMRRLFPEHGRLGIHLPGLSAFGLVLFAPLLGRMFLESWFVDTAALPFHALALWGALGVLDGRREGVSWGVFGLSVFCLSACEWIGPVLAVCLPGLWLFRRYRNRRVSGLVVVGGLGAGVALLLYLGLYSGISGLDSLIELALGKYQMRSGTSAAAPGHVSDLQSWFAIAGAYAAGYSVLLPLAGILGTAALFRLRAPARPLAVLVLALAPVLLHHALLFNWAALHTYSALKGAPALAVLLGCGVAWLSGPQESRRRRLMAAVTVFLLLGAFLMCAFAYHELAGSGAGAKRNLAPLGREIGALAKPNETVVLMGDYKPSPVLLYYAQRNMTRAPDRDTALQLLPGRDLLLLEIDVARGLTGYHRISAEAP